MLIATAGHVDHGKTTLIRALTGTDCDRLAEEKARGITIALGFARWGLPGGRSLSVIDVPGHEKLVRTMLIGAGGIDLVLLAVSAQSGVMPQTREHLNACRVLGVDRGVVAMTFADRVDDVDAAVESIRQELAGSILAEAPIIPVTAPTGAGLVALGHAVEAISDEQTPEERMQLPVCLPVDRVFTIGGFGTVVTGSLLRGVLRVGDAVNLLPSTDPIRIRGLQVHGEARESATPGHRVAVNLAIERSAVSEHALLCTPNHVHSGRVFDAEIAWLPHLKKGLARGRGLTLHLGASRASADARADGIILPGTRGTGRIRLDRALPLPAGGRFVLRGPPDTHHGAVVGGGRILDPAPPRKRAASTRAALAAASTEAALDILLAEAGPRGLAPATVSRRLALPARTDSTHLFAPAVVTTRRKALVAHVVAHHGAHPLEPGVSRASLGSTALDQCALSEAFSVGELVRDSGLVRHREHQVEVDPKTQAMAKKLMRAIGRAGLTAHAEAALYDRFPASDAFISEVLDHLVRSDRVVRFGGFAFPGRELSALRTAAASAVLSGGSLPVSWLKEHAQLTRKHAMPLWLWLDKVGATSRRGNVRVPGPRAREYAHGS